MKVLLYLEKKDLRELLSFQLSSQLPLQVKECGALAEATDYLQREPVDALVCAYEGPAAGLVPAVQALRKDLPTIFLLDEAGTKPARAALSGIAVLGEVAPADLGEGVHALLKDYLDKGARQGEEADDFCPIRTNLLIRATPLQSDIYIRLSKTKFVKLFRTGDEFDNSDLERYYQAKGVEYMYLRRAETAEFIEKFRKELEALLAKPELPIEEGLRAAEMSQEAIHELIHRVGFGEEVQELAKKNVEVTLKAIGAHPRLNELLKNVETGGNYLSQHSTLLALISCCVAKEMEWGSETSFSKLVLASYMHDISIADPELARVNTLRELEEKKDSFAADAVKAYHLHPAKSADIVRSFKEIPADVDLIVQQHHERPNGSGFPRGLSHNYIAPLGTVFIVSHDLTQAIMEARENFDLATFVEEKKPFYNQGNFKKVMTALDKVKL